MWQLGKGNKSPKSHSRSVRSRSLTVTKARVLRGGSSRAKHRFEGWIRWCSTTFMPWRATPIERMVLQERHKLESYARPMPIRSMAEIVGRPDQVADWLIAMETTDERGQ